MSLAEELKTSRFPDELKGLSWIKTMNVLMHHQWLATDGRHGDQLVLKGKEYMNHDMNAFDLSRAVFSGTDFSLSRLAEAKFVGATLRNVRFIGCDLEGADFSNATLENVSFEEARYETACFEGARMKNVQWSTVPPANNLNHLAPEL